MKQVFYAVDAGQRQRLGWQAADFKRMLVLGRFAQARQENGQSRGIKLCQLRGVNLQQGLGAHQVANLCGYRPCLVMGEKRRQLKNAAFTHLRLLDLLRSAKVEIKPSMPLALISCANWVR